MHDVRWVNTRCVRRCRKLIENQHKERASGDPAGALRQLMSWGDVVGGRLLNRLRVHPAPSVVWYTETWSSLKNVV